MPSEACTLHGLVLGGTGKLIRDGFGLGGLDGARREEKGSKALDPWLIACNKLFLFVFRLFHDDW